MYPGLFIDDGGRAYVVHGQGALYLTELTPDLHAVKTPAREIWRGSFGADRRLGTGGFGMEGSHVYRVNGYYYILCPAGGTEGWQVCLRARQLEGPLVFLRAILGCVVLSLDIYGARVVPVRGTSAFSSPPGRGLRQPALHAFFAEMADFFGAGKADFNQPAAIPTPDLVISRQGKMKFRVTLMAT